MRTIYITFQAKIQIYLFVTLVITLSSCNKAQNYRDAYQVIKNDTSFITLRGKRNLMAHDLVSIFANKTYEDSILIPIPTVKSGQINGNTIKFKHDEYTYTYDGWVNIMGDSLDVELFSIDTINHSKEKIDFEWNGHYILHPPVQVSTPHYKQM